MRKLLHIETPPDGKKDNFYGNRSIVILARDLKKIKSDAMTNDLYITDIGFYPHAKHHFRKREDTIDEHILIYCIDGYGSIHLNGKTHEMRPNTYFVIPAGEAHSYWASEQTPWSIYWIHFGGHRSHGFKKFFAQTRDIEPTTSSRIDDRIRLFNEILTSLELGFTRENLIYANLCLNSLLASFFYVYTYRAVRGFHKSDPVEQAIFYMQENMDQCLKVEDMAHHVKLSESHFTKVFRNKTGSSPIEYFINLKMQEAVRLLTQKSLRIKEVANQLGYNDPYYFTRIFTKRFGSSPGTYIKITKK